MRASIPCLVQGDAHTLLLVACYTYQFADVAHVVDAFRDSRPGLGACRVPTFNPIDPEQFGHPSECPSSDIVLLNRTVTMRRNYRRGDIVTLYCPNDPNRLITKRILALGGDTVRVWVPKGIDLTPASSGGDRADVVSLAYTNMYQKALRELASEIEDHASGAWLSITIPPQYAWVEGDASAQAPTMLSQLHPYIKSRDSREFGPVPLGLVTSRVEYILWPPGRFGRPSPRPM